MTSAKTAPVSEVRLNPTIEERFGHFFRGRKMNLGSGPTSLPDFTNVDLYCDADVKCDISKPWPFADGSFDTIFASHVLEHFSGEECLFLFSEMGRVLVPGGCLIAVVPYGRSRYHYSNPFHKFGWTEGTPSLFDRRIYTDETGLSFRREQGQHMYPWSVLDMFYRLADGWGDKPEEERDFAIRHYFNVVEEMFFVMRRERE